MKRVELPKWNNKNLFEKILHVIGLIVLFSLNILFLLFYKKIIIIPQILMIIAANKLNIPIFLSYFQYCIA